MEQINFFILSNEINTWFIFINFFLILIFNFVVFSISKKNKINLFLSFSLYYYHLFFSFLYLEYTFRNQADIFDYWYTSEFYLQKLFYNMFVIPDNITNSLLHIVGSDTILFVIALFRFFNFDFLSTNIIFNFIGFLGIINYFLIFRKLSSLNNKFILFLSVIILFFPSLHFWSSSIGKDSLIFYAISLILLNFISHNGIKSYILGFLIIILIRPYIGVFILTSYIFYFLINLNFNNLRNIISLIVISLITFFTIFIASTHLSISFSDLNLNYISELLKTVNEERRVNFINNENFVDVTSKNFVENLLFYIFYPFFTLNEINNMFLLILSIENLIILSILLISIILFNLHNLDKSKIVTLVFFSFLTLLFLSSVTQNIGIILRQKWMIMPIIFSVVLSIISSYKFDHIK
mgnify:CR=1 FL=1|tara:strand:+ start:579 stop:1805 length:1227 start_codon:yes stop_codon:yes gene_type:complete